MSLFAPRQNGLGSSCFPRPGHWCCPEPTPAKQIPTKTMLVSNPCVQECDFEGRAALDPEQCAASPLAACFNSGSLDQHLVYTGK